MVADFGGEMALREQVGPPGADDPRAAALAAALRDTRFGSIGWVGETGSTNADLLELGTRLADGTVLVADHQTAGRGRRDRTWVTAPGDALLISVLLRPRVAKSAFGLLTAAVAVAAAEACRGSGHDAVAIKWPNDLVIGQPPERRKVAGVLAQSSVTADDAVVVVGMGLNLISARLGPMAATAAALDELGPGISAPRLAELVLGRLDPLLAAVESGDHSDLWDRYRSLSATLGTHVRVTLDDRTIEGQAVDIEPTGALLVDTATSRESVVVGDVVSLR